MKIIHSLWSKPNLLYKEHNNTGGWLDKKFHYASWALSCLTVKKVYGNIELITDKEGYNLLIKKLKLPYTNVRIVLDDLNNYNENLWAIGKLYAYSIQEKPFIHIDGDVYIWNRFGSEVEEAQLIAQEVDPDKGHYSFAIDEARKNNFTLPFEMEKDLQSESQILAVNAGILGGSDLDFIKHYCKLAFKFIDSNINKTGINGTSYAILYEQYLFSCLARKEKKKIHHYLNNSLNKKEYLDFNPSSFKNKYFSPLKYTHIYGRNKKDLRFSYQLINQLQLEYPEYYNLIEKITSK